MTAPRASFALALLLVSGACGGGDEPSAKTRCDQVRAALQKRIEARAGAQARGDEVAAAKYRVEVEIEEQAALRIPDCNVDDLLRG
ncbi:MAG: hypothetical protein ABR520_00425 [Mycobacteriales bacterium]|nr:hypothetical protein [Frankia sp.]